MKAFALSGMLASLQRSAARLECAAAKLGRDRRGVAAVEFAIIVPLMLVMFFGTVEFSSAVAVDRKVSMTVQSLADLASRYTSIGDTDMTNFTIIANAMMTPYSSTPLQTTVTEVYIDPSTGVARTQWSKGAAPRAVSSTVPVPANLIARDSSNNIIAAQYLIFSEASYVYTPAVGYVMRTGVTLSDKSYMRPRLSTCVLYNTTTGNCPTS
jgi:Flp pilus assembly protein TadG